jgi:hypothetical protein
LLLRRGEQDEGARRMYIPHAEKAEDDKLDWVKHFEKLYLRNVARKNECWDW